MSNSKRGPGRPPLAEGERPVRHMVNLPPDLAREAERVRQGTPWGEWLRGLVERAVGRDREARR